jgi:hypothetical protein
VGTPSKLSPRLQITYKRVTDTNGKELDVPTYIAISQFRELFVQKISRDGCYFQDDIFIDKDKPLFQNFIPTDREVNYTNWMNTPLKKMN